MTRRKRSPSPNDSLKAERVQRTDAATDVGDHLKGEGVRLRSRRLPPQGWYLETSRRLTKTFEYQDRTAARYAAEAARAVSQGWEPAPYIRCSGDRLTVTLIAPHGEDLREVDLLRAATIEERCG